ncbi:hypothetical protein AVEN_251262-1 [Araneus ventricosus]|uniref:Uncharacterized protein n=1 Tax=Araneus ventricosus TaxID=182803 RepID=A0A4Y2XAS4_ARAVE|nr:hypothetical protein AVEN_251262-1 [Araneus ventricosus]
MINWPLKERGRLATPRIPPRSIQLGPLLQNWFCTNTRCHLSWQGITFVSSGCTRSAPLIISIDWLAPSCKRHLSIKAQRPCSLAPKSSAIIIMSARTAFHCSTLLSLQAFIAEPPAQAFSFLR